MSAPLPPLHPPSSPSPTRFGAVEPIRIAPDGLEHWRTQFRLLSAAETWSIHGAWIEAAKPVFGPAIAERFAFAREASGRDVAPVHEARAAIGRRLREIVGDDGVICLPTAPGPAPLRDADRRGGRSLPPARATAHLHRGPERPAADQHSRGHRRRRAGRPCP